MIVRRAYPFVAIEKPYSIDKIYISSKFVILIPMDLATVSEKKLH